MLEPAARKARLAALKAAVTAANAPGADTGVVGSTSLANPLVDAPAAAAANTDAFTFYSCASSLLGCRGLSYGLDA